MMTSPSEFQLSIDPSLRSTGLVLWSQGKVVKHHTIKTSTKYDFAERIRQIAEGMRIFVGGRNVAVVAVEEFQTFSKNSMKSMLKCAAAQGALIATGWVVSAEVRMVNKGTEKKEVARKAAAEFGLSNLDEHRADAFRLGQLAGFADEKA